MRTEKLEFARRVGDVHDLSWMSLSEEDSGYELEVRTDLRGSNQDYDNQVYTEWNNSELDNSIDTGREAEKPQANYGNHDGIRTVNPGTSRESQTPFSLDHFVHEGLLGEIQAAVIYDKAAEHIDTNRIELYDFVEWYNEQPARDMNAILKYGPEDCFAVDDSGIESSLERFVEEHEMDGVQLKSGLNGEVVAELNGDRKNSILRQSGLKAVNGILTQNPEQVKRMVNGE